MLGRMSRLSLRNDDFDGFVTPTASSTPTKTLDAFSPTPRPMSLYAGATPTRLQRDPSSAARPTSLYIPSRAPTRTQSVMSHHSPAVSPRTQDAFPDPAKATSSPTAPKKSPLKTAIKSIQKAARTIAKATLPGYRTSQAYKQFQRTVAEEDKAAKQPEVPPPVPPHALPYIPEEDDRESVSDSDGGP